MEKRNLDSYDIIFYRKGKKYFFKYEGNEYEANNININNLNLVLKLPYIHPNRCQRDSRLKVPL